MSRTSNFRLVCISKKISQKFSFLWNDFIRIKHCVNYYFICETHKISLLNHLCNQPTKRNSNNFSFNESRISTSWVKKRKQANKQLCLYTLLQHGMTREEKVMMQFNVCCIRGRKKNDQRKISMSCFSVTRTSVKIIIYF